MWTTFAILAITVICASAGDKIWSPPSTSTAQWLPIGHDSPCARRSFVYQRNAHLEFAPHSAAETDRNASAVERIALPSSGVLMLQQPIVFAAAAEAACPPTSSWADYHQQSDAPLAYWFDPSAWRNDADAGRPNLARPLVDRVPCECDSVQFVGLPAGASLAIGLRPDDEVRVRSVRLNERRGTIDQMIAAAAPWDIGQLLFPDSLGTVALPGDAGSQCTGSGSVCGCHAAERFERVERAVCEHVRCPADDRLQCADAIRVAGACCPVCGAQFQTDMTLACPQRLLAQHGELALELRRVLHEAEGGKWLDRVDYDISVRPEVVDDGLGGLRRLYWGRLVLVDRGAEYRGDSADLAEVLRHNEIFRAYFRQFDIAGPAIRPGQSRHRWMGILIGCLVAVLCIYGALFVFYERRPWLDAMAERSERLWLRFRHLNGAPMTFRRFDNTASMRREPEAGSRVHIVEEEQAIPVIPPPAVEEAIHEIRVSSADAIDGGFDNPLFRESTTAADVAAANLLNVDGELDGNSAGNASDPLDAQQSLMECENLVDIDLETCETVI